MLLRSILFAPGNQEKLAIKALEHESDAVAIDLEDAVPAAEKNTALANIAGFLAAANKHGKPFFVRSNGIETEWFPKEIEDCVAPGLAGIILPMVEDAQHLLFADDLIGTQEKKAGLESGTVELMPLIETCLAFSNLREILQEAPKRVGRVNFGAWDYSRDAGITAGEDEREFEYARMRIVIESRAAGLPAPIDASYADLRNLEGMSASCMRAKRHGFCGKACIHPAQVAIANTEFSPSAKELAHAQQVVEALKQAQSEGRMATRVNGKFVDLPMLTQAEELLAKFSEHS